VKRTESILPVVMMLLLTGLVTPSAKAESIILVHMIDARSALPIANKPVRLWTRSAADERNDPGYVQEMTDSNGVATFHLEDPIPSYLYIHIGMGAVWEECFPDAQNGFGTQEILGSGVSKESGCSKRPDMAKKFHPTPGDVYIFAMHDNAFLEGLKALGRLTTH
jgi:hypothetical protein